MTKAKIGEEPKMLGEHRVACITTNSLCEILKLFACKSTEPTYYISRLRAIASNGEKNPPLVDDKYLGIKIHVDSVKASVVMDYKLNFKNRMPENPIDEEEVSKALEYLHKYQIKDAAVETLEVIVRDPEIGRLAGVPEDLFHMTLKSDPTDGDMDEIEVKKEDVNQELIKYYRFKHRILHCRYLIDRKQYLSIPQSQWKYLIFWRGRTGTSLISPEEIAQQVKTHFTPYGLIKLYGVEAEDKLVLLEVSR